MGRFMLYNGEVRPSDSYFSSHSLPDYEPNDWFNDSYNVEDDNEVLYIQRSCQRCGASFNLYDAMSDYASKIDYPAYIDDYVGDLCSDCAVEQTRRNFSE